MSEILKEVVDQIRVGYTVSDQLFNVLNTTNLGNGSDISQTMKFIENEDKLLKGKNHILKEYIDIIFGKNYKKLQSKTKKQIGELKNFWIEENYSGVAKGVHIFRNKINLSSDKIKPFLELTASLVPIRKDDDLKLEEFKSPLITGVSVSSGAKGYDGVVRAQNYVYGSFDLITHPMAGGSFIADENTDVYELETNLGYKKGSEKNFNTISTTLSKALGLRRIEEKDINSRSEIVMMDIADVSVISSKTQTSMIQIYLNNLFDYKGGKELLAYYLGLIFKNVDEARDFFTHTPNCSRISATNFFDYDFRFFSDVEGLDPIKNQRLFEIKQRMIELYNKFGILPPLELEVRIPDAARIQEGW